MNSLATLAQNVVFVGWDLNRTVSAKNGIGTLRSAFTSRRFVTALMDCAFLGLHDLAVRKEKAIVGTRQIEPLINFVVPLLLSVDMILEKAALPGAPISIDYLEAKAIPLRAKYPDVHLAPGLVDEITAFAARYPGPAIEQAADMVPA